MLGMCSRPTLLRYLAIDKTGRPVRLAVDYSPLREERGPVKKAAGRLSTNYLCSTKKVIIGIALCAAHTLVSKR